MANLSTGVLESLMLQRPVQWPVYLQLQEVKQVVAKNSNAAKRYRILVSDGQYTYFLMIATQMAEAIEAQQQAYVPGAILQFSEIISNDVNGRRVMIALNFQVVGHHNETIGNPVPLPEPGAAAVQQAPPAGGASSMPPHQDQNVPPSNGQPPAAYGAGAFVKPEPNGALPNQFGGPPAPGYGGNQYGQAPNSAPPGTQFGGPPHAAAPGPQYGAPNNGPYGAQQGGGPPGGQGNWNGPPHQGFGGPPAGGPMSGPGGPGSFMGRAPPAQYNPNAGGPVAPPAQYNLNAGGPVARNEAAARIVPIRTLNPYNGRWTIKARCTSKGEMKRFNNARGDGRLFGFDLLDKDGGEIKVTAFGDQADKFFDVVQVGNVYTLSKASLQQKKAQFNHTSHDYEIRLDRESVLVQCEDDGDTQAIPSVNFNFVPIANIENCEVGAHVDVIGVLEQVNEGTTIVTRKTGSELRKRPLVIRDQSNRSVEITLWGVMVDDVGAQLEEMFKANQRPVVAFKAVRVGDYNGRSLGTSQGTVIKIDPAGPAALAVQNWYNSGGAAQQAVSLTGTSGAGVGRNDRRCTLQAIKDENLGREGKAEFVLVYGTIHAIGNSRDRGIMYPACPAMVESNNANGTGGRTCNKKMTLDEIDNGNSYRCVLCGPATPTWRYMLSLAVADHTKSEWLTAFSETGELLFGGMTADAYREKEQVDGGFADRMQESLRYQTVVCKIKAAEDNYNDELRVKLSLTKVELANPVKEGYVMLEQISKLEQGLPVLTARDPGGQQPQAAAGGAARMGAGQAGGARPMGYGNTQQGGQGGNAYGGGGGQGMGGGGAGFGGGAGPSRGPGGGYGNNAGGGGGGNAGGWAQPGGGGGGGANNGGNWGGPGGGAYGGYNGGAPAAAAGPYGGNGAGYGGGGGGGGYAAPMQQQQPARAGFGGPTQGQPGGYGGGGGGAAPGGGYGMGNQGGGGAPGGGYGMGNQGGVGGAPGGVYGGGNQAVGGAPGGGYGMANQGGGGGPYQGGGGGFVQAPQGGPGGNQAGGQQGNGANLGQPMW